MIIKIGGTTLVLTVVMSYVIFSMRMAGFIDEPAFTQSLYGCVKIDMAVVLLAFYNFSLLNKIV
jgi:hypothetical protein